MRQQQLQSFSICKSILMVVKMRYLELRRQCLLHKLFQQDSTGYSGECYSWKESTCKILQDEIVMLRKDRKKKIEGNDYKTSRQKKVSRVLAG